MSEGVGTSGRRKTISKKARFTHCIWVCLVKLFVCKNICNCPEGIVLIRTKSKLSNYKFD